MKSIVVVLCLLFPVIATAQNQGFNMGNMQQMMQLMQQCMAKIDQTELETLQQQSEKMSKELDTLCKKGERNKAQKKALAYGKKMMQNPALVQVKKCGEITKGILPENSNPAFDNTFDFSDGNVCDK